MSRTVIIREITATEHIASAWALLEAHRDELTTDPDLMRLNPRRRAYEVMELAGAMLSLGAFQGDELVGYSINFVDRNLHYADVVVAQNDLLFVRRDLRGRVGLQLIRETEKLAAERGANMVLWHAKPNTPLDHLMPKLGYRVQDVVYSRVL